ncbi:diguanylate phosphodiesterase, partial [Mesorhizobium sp. M1C.F.Ca.ET.193.01.1.1]|uniref:PAS-domain containing protein n=1 Tax=Mesorhizobium sp. M1C.F.Ca.ET.193.01.1.1 TaxID=2563926 RepID=UPI00113FA663
MPGAHVKTGSVAGRRRTTGIGPARRIAEELRAQNERFSAAVENMSRGLCMFDADERIMICNRKYLDSFDLDDRVLKHGIRFFDIV